MNVGDVVTVDRACLDNGPGARAICVERYTLQQRDGWFLLFENGNYDGFSPQDVDLFGVRVIGHLHVHASYVFRNVLQLATDYHRGLFHEAWAR